MESYPKQLFSKRGGSEVYVKGKGLMTLYFVEVDKTNWSVVEEDNIQQEHTLSKQIIIFSSKFEDVWSRVKWFPVCPRALQ